MICSTLSVNKALKLYGAYSHNTFVEEFYEELLGSMDIASVVVNANLEVLSANQQARQILSSDDGFFGRALSAVFLMFLLQPVCMDYGTRSR